jgi:hypothetical protein
MSREMKYRLTFIGPKAFDAGSPSGVDFAAGEGRLAFAVLGHAAADFEKDRVGPRSLDSI